MDIQGFLDQVKKNRCRLITSTQRALYQTVIAHGYRGRRIEQDLKTCCPPRFRQAMRELIKCIPYSPKIYTKEEVAQILLKDYAQKRFITPQDMKILVIEVSNKNEETIKQIEAIYGGPESIFYMDLQEIKDMTVSFNKEEVKFIIQALDQSDNKYQTSSVKEDIATQKIYSSEKLKQLCQKQKVFLKPAAEVQLFWVVQNLTISNQFCKQKIESSTYPQFVQRLTIICSIIVINESVKNLRQLVGQNTSKLYDYYMLQDIDIQELIRSSIQKDQITFSKIIEDFAIEKQTIQKFQKDLQLVISHVDQALQKHYISSIMQIFKDGLNNKSSIILTQISCISQKSEKEAPNKLELASYRTILHQKLLMEKTDIKYLFNRILFYQSSGLQALKKKYQLEQNNIKQLQGFLRKIAKEQYQQLNLHKIEQANNEPKPAEQEKGQNQIIKTGQYLSHQIIIHQQEKEEKQNTPIRASSEIQSRKIERSMSSSSNLSPQKPVLSVESSKEAFDPIDKSIILNQIVSFQGTEISGMIVILSKQQMGTHKIKQSHTNRGITPLESNFSFNDSYLKILYFKGQLNGSYQLEIGIQKKKMYFLSAIQEKQFNLQMNAKDLYMNSKLFFLNCYEENREQSIRRMAPYALFQAVSFLVQKIYLKPDVLSVCILPWLKIISNQFKKLKLNHAEQIERNKAAIIQACSIKSRKSLESSHFCLYLLRSLYNEQQCYSFFDFEFLGKIFFPEDQLIPFENKQYPNAREIQYFWIKSVLYAAIICPSHMRDQQKIKRLLIANIQFLPHDDVIEVLEKVAEVQISLLVRMDHQIRSYFLKNIAFSADDYWVFKMKYIDQIFANQGQVQNQTYLLGFMEDIIRMLRGDHKQNQKSVVDYSKDIKFLLTKQAGIFSLSNPQLRVSDSMIPELYIKCKRISYYSKYTLNFTQVIAPILESKMKILSQNYFVNLFLCLLVNPSQSDGAQSDRGQLKKLIQMPNCNQSAMKEILQKLFVQKDIDVAYFNTLVVLFLKKKHQQTKQLLSVINQLFRHASQQSHKIILEELFSIFLRGTDIGQISKSIHKTSVENDWKFIEDIVFYQKITVPSFRQLYFIQLFSPLKQQFKNSQWKVAVLIDNAFINFEGKNNFQEILRAYLDMVGGLKANDIANLIQNYLEKNIQHIKCYQQRYPQQFQQGLQLFIDKIKCQKFTAREIAKINSVQKSDFSQALINILDQAAKKLKEFQTKLQKACLFISANYPSFKQDLIRLENYEAGVKTLQLCKAYQLPERDNFLIENISKIELFYKIPSFKTYTITQYPQLIQVIEAVHKLFSSQPCKIFNQSITYKMFRDWFCQECPDDLLKYYGISNYQLELIKKYRKVTIQHCKELYEYQKSIQFTQLLIKGNPYEQMTIEDDIFFEQLQHNNGEVLLLKTIQEKTQQYRKWIIFTLSSSNIIVGQSLQEELLKLMPIIIMQKAYKLRHVLLKLKDCKIDTSVEMDNQQKKIMGNIVVINEYLQLVEGSPSLEGYFQKMLAFKEKYSSFEGILQFCIDAQQKIFSLLGLMGGVESFRHSIVQDQ